MTAEEVPILKFERDLAASSGLRDQVGWMLTQLGVPPNLTHLRDGLLRSKRILERHGEQFDTCLLIIPGQRLESVQLVNVIDTALTFIDAQGWPADDQRLTPISPIYGSMKHPLDGYCLTVCHHWRNLFYVLEPDPEASATDGAAMASEYERLLSEVAAHVLAANSYSTPKGYFRYCSLWWKEDRRPSFPPFADPPIYGRDESASPDLLFQRQGNAARATHMLGCLEQRFFLKLLRPPEDLLPFHERLSEALFDELRWERKERDLMSTISLLVRSVRPGWQIRTTSRAKTSPRGSARRHVLGGYDQIPASNILVHETETESGEIFECLFVDPRDGRKSPETEDGDDLETPARGIDALIREEQDADTLRWMPLIDRTDQELVTFQVLNVDDEVRARAGGRPLRSRWAAEHLRRWHFAHGLTKESLSVTELKQISDAMMRPIGDKSEAALVGLLHVSLATGRTIRAARSIQLASGPADAEPGADTNADSYADSASEANDVRYRLDLKQWELRVSPPAWADKEVTEIERPLVTWLLLPDLTGFHTFLSRQGLDQKDFDALQKVTKARRAFLGQWLFGATHDPHATVAACQKVLFQRLLVKSRGDVGVAALLTGTGHSHSLSVSHYSHYSLRYVQDVYRLALSEPSTSSAVRSLGRSNSRRHRGDGIGARRVPTFAAVRRLLGKLRHEVELARSKDDVARAHNLFTAYVIVGLVLGIGLRAIIDPHLIDIHARIPLITFLDKARSDYHRRVSALPALILEQLTLYSTYLRHFKAMRGPSTGSIPYAFAFIDESTGEIEAFRPVHFLALVKDYYELELYSLRRFARSTLIQDSKVEGEDLDAWMGHWFDRVSPHDRLSSYPMRRLADFAAGPVQRMLSSLNYRAIGFNEWL